MSKLTLELMDDPELLRLADQAHAEVRAQAIKEGRTYTMEEVEERIGSAMSWRKRALRAEAKLRALDTPTPEDGK